MSDTPLIRHLGLVPYESTWRAMQRFTDERDASTRDEIWFLEHPPVFTLGLNASLEHVKSAGAIPVVQIDRGGQVTTYSASDVVDEAALLAGAPDVTIGRNRISVPSAKSPR